MQFTDKEDLTIKKRKSVYLENREIYQSKNPIPLYPVLIASLLCNYFNADGKSDFKLTLYYDGEKHVNGDIMRFDADS